MSTTDIAVHTDHSNGVAIRDHVGALETFVATANHAASIAKIVAQTDFVPASLRDKPGNITTAILAGLELGLQPMAALRSMDVIYGVPALRAHAMRGLVQSHGHHIQLVESSDTRCVMRGRRAGEQEWQAVEWTIERANKMGLPQRKSKRDPSQPNQWQLQPKTMLAARATGEICRLIAADVLFAMPYAAEELDRDEREQPAPVITRVTAAEILGTGTATVDPPPQVDEADWPETAQPPQDEP